MPTAMQPCIQMFRCSQQKSLSSLLEKLHIKYSENCFKGTQLELAFKALALYKLVVQNWRAKNASHWYSEKPMTFVMW